MERKAENDNPAFAGFVTSRFSTYICISLFGLALPLGSAVRYVRFELVLFGLASFVYALILVEATSNSHSNYTYSACLHISYSVYPSIHLMFISLQILCFLTYNFVILYIFTTTIRLPVLFTSSHSRLKYNIMNNKYMSWVLSLDLSSLLFSSSSLSSLTSSNFLNGLN